MALPQNCLNSDFSKTGPSFWSSIDLPSSSGAKGKSHSSGKRGHHRTPQEGRQDGVRLLLKVVARKLSTYFEAKELVSEEQCGFRSDRSTTDMMFVVHRLQEIGRKTGVSLFMCSINLQKAYDAVDRTVLWQVRTRIGVPPQMIAVIR